ncbi:hypothetical protein SH2C18_39040 [Clostridium sediminicola]|uniref:hypothetical protein n=1 Tax=Clostridium sediminicola TaxID=3114879 RepID=UPI0031F1C5FE
MRGYKILIAIALGAVLLIPSFTGCNKNEREISKEEGKKTSDVSTQETKEEVPPVADKEPKVTSQKGDIVDSDKLYNKEGNYEVPIITDWIGKVSYVMDGTSTIIYHITKDKNELELNPELLHIDVANSGDSFDGEVFMEIDGKSYYYIPRFDFPYSEGSADAIEFSAFYDDIQIVLQSVWLIDESAWQDEIKSKNIGTKPKGTVVDNTTILFGSGNYTVTVPNNWVRKVSYKVSQNTITFYHITIDPDEYEISPEIMKIDVADGMLSDGPEVAYSNGDYTYYYTPRFDFPYKEGSDDAKEFTALTDDLEKVLESCKYK